jgi:hypothetical protein
MPPFPKPELNYIVNVAKEIKSLTDYKKKKPERVIPKKAANKLLLATWNIANFGLQKREQ